MLQMSPHAFAIWDVTPGPYKLGPQKTEKRGVISYDPYKYP